MHETDVKHSRILIVDDQEVNVLLVKEMLLAAGYSKIMTTTDSREAVRLCAQIKPDLIVLDLHMPHLDGFGVMEALRARTSPAEFLPILVITADTTGDTRRQALSLGATDFLSKPFDSTEVMLRARNLLQTRRLFRQVQAQQRRLEATAREHMPDWLSTVPDMQAARRRRTR